MTLDEERRLLSYCRWLARVSFAIGAVLATALAYYDRTPWGAAWMLPWAVFQASEIRQAIRVRNLTIGESQ